MKTQYYTASSLDGFIADANDSLDWLFPLGDIETTGYPAFFRDVGALAMGSTTYKFVRGDVRPVHREMANAAAGRNVWIVGGGDLAGQFYDAGLLDEMIVSISSVTLGSGAPLFPRRIMSPPLRLVSVAQCGSGFAELCCEIPRGTSSPPK